MHKIVDRQRRQEEVAQATAPGLDEVKRSTGVPLFVWIPVLAATFEAGPAKAQTAEEPPPPDETELTSKAEPLVEAESLTEVDASGEATDPFRPSRSYPYLLYVRPFAGIGWTDSFGDSRNGLAFHAGGRVLVPTPTSPKVGGKFGIETSYVALDVRKDNAIPERYFVVGGVWEMTFVRHLTLSTGLAGYIGLRDTAGNSFGIITDVGWEPAWDSRFVPYVTLRSEFIFADRVYSVLALSVGFTVGVF